jgi:hypothetical protein
MGMCESPDFQPHLEFGQNALEQVKVPEYSLEERYQSDMDRERKMRRKFGENGPGEPPKKSLPEAHRDMLAAQQDIDGLPWEVRWRKSLIPTAEEVVQEIRDRFDLYIMDPIEREMEWYLHWKDRTFRMEKDRLIWPQGFTDYLDHYDEHGRRRVLPTDQRWSDTSWKHLSDTNYRNRMWLLEGEQRKAAHQQLQDKETLLQQEEQRLLDQGDVFAAMQSGIIDINPDQAYEALSGTADPVEVAKTKLKIQAYGAKEMAEAHIPKGPEQRDPVTGLPRSDLEALPCGLTVEQGAHVAATVAVKLDMIDTAGELALVQGKDPHRVVQHAHLSGSKEHGDQPALLSVANQAIANIKREQQLLDSETQQVSAKVDAKRLTAAVEALEEAVGEQHSMPTADKVAPNANGSRRTQANASGEGSPLKEGYLEVTPRPRGAEPSVPHDMYDTPRDSRLDEVPEWYLRQAVEVGPMIETYGQVHDPIEEARSSKAEYYTPPQITPGQRISADRYTQGSESSFDERRLQKEKTMPELVNAYKPLPLFKEVAKEQETTGTEGAGQKKKKTLKRSEELKKEREERAAKAKQQMDPDAMLPTLPWETSSLHDPYRGVAKEDLVPYDKPALEKTWFAYRSTFQQMMTEFSNLSGIVSEEQAERLLLDSIQRFRKGEVSSHPPIDPDQEGIIRLIFEGHTKQFMSDFLKTRGGKTMESNVAKQESEDLLKRAGARSKLQGPNFMNFIQEMTALELDQVRSNPVQKYAVFIRDKKLQPLGKPFLQWIEKELMEFTMTRFTSGEHLEVQYTLLSKTVNETKHRCPMRIEGVTDGTRDMFVTALHCWCRASIAFHSAKKHMELYLLYAETRFRSRAETLFEDAYELYGEYAKAAQGNVSIPLPDTDPMYDVEEKDFLDGENGTLAEVQGHLDKAEGIWHSGTNRRWYPLLDETEYMWYNERRGRISLTIDISARCLEALNKKTHPSVHPFPERGYPFLEGAPLTQETAEHLWMRYMGDVYFEHSLTMARLGQYATAKEHLQRCHNLYTIAIRTAKERLPSSWKAPLLTQAKLLLRSFDGRSVSAASHCAAIERTTEAMYAMSPRPDHWVHIYDNVPMRIALTMENQVAYAQLIQDELKKELKGMNLSFTDQELMSVLELRARGHGVPAKFDVYFDALSRSAEKNFRQVVAKWRSKELEGSDAYYLWTHHYFTFRIKTKSAEEVAQLWEMYEPAFLYIYTQAALGSRTRGYALLSDAVRRMSQTLVEGNGAQKKILLAELVKVREKLAHIIDRRELDRAITTLEAHLANPAAMPHPYIYGSQIILNQTSAALANRGNLLLKISTGSKDYAEIKQRLEDTRAGNMASSAPKLDDAQGTDSTQMTASAPRTAVNTRSMFADKN